MLYSDQHWQLFRHHRHEPRTLDQLEATLVDVFLYKFHNFKKEFDLIVREDFCRVDKEKFDYILFRFVYFRLLTLPHFFFRRHEFVGRI